MNQAPEASQAFEHLWHQVKEVLRRKMSEPELNEIVKDMTGKKLQEALDKL